MSQQANPEDDDVRPEYDFTGAVRGKHHAAYKAGSNIVLLDPDVAQVFKDSEQVNRALRMLLQLAKERLATIRERALADLRPKRPHRPTPTQLFMVRTSTRTIH